MIRTQPSRPRIHLSPRAGTRPAALLAAIVLLGMPAPAQDRPVARPSMSMSWTSFDEQGGAALYANVCAACHQPDAKGAVGAAAYPALAGDAKLASADYMLSVLLYGSRGMPPIGRMMSDAQLADVINYVRSHFGNDFAGTVAADDVKAARPQ